MITEKLLTNAENYNKSVKRAAEILISGGIVGIPTETVYGLAADACNEEAIKKVFIAKGRPQDNPLIVHICNTEMLKDVACDIPDTAIKCAKEFWPGPFTMVLNRTEKTANVVSAGLNTVAVRMPSHKTALEVIAAANLPLAAPSANVSGSPSPTTALHVQNDLEGKIDAIIYDDECEVGVESTVVSFVCNPPRLLRPGAVTPEQLYKIIPDLEIDDAVLAKLKDGEIASSPGMKYKHYAPKCDAYLVEGESEAFCEFVNSIQNAVAICFSEEADKIKIPKLIYGSNKDQTTLAHKCFSVLREVDGLMPERAYIHAPSKNGVGLAVYNRLLRAAGFKVIKL